MTPHRFASRRSFAAAGGFALAALVAFAPAAHAAWDESSIDRLRAVSPGLVVEKAPLSGEVASVRRLSVPTTGDSDFTRARAFVVDFGVADDATNLVDADVRASRAMTVVRFTETFAGLPVLGGEVLVTLDNHKRVTHVSSTLKRVRALAASTLSDDAAALVGARAALADPTFDGSAPMSVVVAVRPDGVAVRAVKVIVARPRSFDAIAVVVDTSTGAILSSSPATVR